MDMPLVCIEKLSKSFTLHTQGQVTISVLDGVDLTVNAGQCVALCGPSGAGKSSLIRCLYANYLPQGGRILIRHEDVWVDLMTATPNVVLDIRKRTMGYVSQFLRVIPRVPALDVVSEPLRALGIDEQSAHERAEELLMRLQIPRRMWSLAPATFSGGEQQRINIARGFVVNYPVLLLDEPTASLDAKNCAIVVELILEAKARGAAIIGIFHDQAVRAAVTDVEFPLQPSEAAA